MSKTTHLAILGRQPEHGLVELESILGPEDVEPLDGRLALIHGDLELSRLGGVIKLARVIYDGPLLDARELPLPYDDFVALGAKITFGVSGYGSWSSSRSVTALGLEVKKHLRKRVAVRFVVPTRGAELTAAQIKFNHILENGFELNVFAAGNRMVLALTGQVQDIDWYSKRDFDRPARSAKVGMLPPKLAQVLLNTTRASFVYDPFCGTGVVLQEALLQNRAAAGSDLSREMVDATHQNLTWLAQQVAAPLPPWSVEEADARNVRFPDLELAVVSEGYLGPNLTQAPQPTRLQEIIRELRALYTEALVNWARQLDSGSELAVCLPAWRLADGWHYLGIVDDCTRLGYTVKVFKHAKTPILYSRADQVVGRQLLLLRKT